MGAQRAPGRPGAWWNLGPGKVSPGTGRSAPPCSPRHSDSSHIQCISGKREDASLGIPFGSRPPVLHPTPWTFPQLPTLITSHTELSSFSLVPLLQGVTTSPSLWAGPVGALFMPSPYSPHSLPGPSPIPPAPQLCHRLSPPSPYLQVQLRPHSLLDHCPSLLPSFLASSLPPTCPPPSLFLHLAPPLPLLCSELSLGTLEAGDKFQGQPGGWTWAGHSHCRKSSSHTGTQAGSSRTPGHPADLWGQESSCEAG